MVDQYRYVMTLVNVFAHSPILRRKRRGMVPVKIQLNVIQHPQGVVASAQPISVTLGSQGSPNASASISLPGSYTFNTAGRYAVEVTVSENGVTQDRSVKGIIVQDSVTLEEVLDTDSDNRLSDAELLEAIEFWKVGAPVPGSGGIVIREAQIQDLQKKRDSHQALVNRAAPSSFTLTMVGDQEFYKLSDDKEWWQRQEEVLNLVDSLFSVRDPSFPGMDIKVKALEAWSTSN